MRVRRGCGDLKSGARAVSAHVSPTQILPLLTRQHVVCCSPQASTMAPSSSMSRGTNGAVVVQGLARQPQSEGSLMLPPSSSENLR